MTSSCQGRALHLNGLQSIKDREGEIEPFSRRTLEGHDPNDFAIRVEQRAAAVAGIHCGIGLDQRGALRHNSAKFTVRSIDDGGARLLVEDDELEGTVVGGEA